MNHKYGQIPLQKIDSMSNSMKLRGTWFTEKLQHCRVWGDVLKFSIFHILYVWCSLCSGFKQQFSPQHIISVLNSNKQLRNPDYHLHLQATLSLLHAHEKPGLDVFSSWLIRTETETNFSQQFQNLKHVCG